MGEAYPRLTAAALGSVRTLTYKARDGVMIPAYLTLPPSSTGKGLPLVVFPHDGPAARDDYVFDWMAQFLASRGYAVLQPQYRGSTGFGEAWLKAGRQQWGAQMQEDVTDGVAALVEQGVADPHRVGIIGVGFGGYAALSGVAFTHKVFRCAVSINGISDMPGQLGYIRLHWGDYSQAFANWKNLLGSQFDKSAPEKSPHQLASLGGLNAPVLLLHAAQDTFVPPQQSESLAYVLKQWGKPVTFIKLDGDTHDLTRTASRTRVLSEIETFLDAHLLH